MKKILTTILLMGLFLPLLAQNPDFDRKYQVAKSLYDQAKYEAAKRSIQGTLKNLPSLSSSQIQQGNKLVSQCDQAIASRDRLDLSTAEIQLPFGSCLDSVGFVAAKPSLVTATSSAADWCQVEKVENEKVFLRTQMNPNKSPRQAEVTISMGRIKRKLIINQNPRPETIKQVRITTTPKSGSITVDGGMAITGVWEGKLEAGSHRIHAKKDDYFPRDTIITVLDDMKDDQMDITIPLRLQCGRIRVEVLPEEGFSFKDINPYTLTINGRIVENDNYSYDDDRNIVRYSLYEDGTIPVPAGRVNVVASADAFERERQEIQVGAGEEVSTTLTLKAKYGRLSLIDAGQAYDAMVSVDGKPVCTVQEFTNYRLGIGNHMITLEKEGYASEFDSYSVAIAENENVSLRVDMFRYVPYVFESTPTDAQVFVDGEFVGSTPTKTCLLKETTPHRPYSIQIVKDGYLSKEENIYPDYDNPEPQTLSFDLASTYKLTIAADRNDIKLYIKDKRAGTSTFVNGTLLPAEVAIPLRDEPYYLELQRVGRKGAYFRKRLLFNNPEQNQYSFRIWGRSSIFSANMFLLGPSSITVGRPEDIGLKQYMDLGTIQLGSFQLFSGLTTSVARALFFLGKDKSEFKNSSGANLHSIQNANFLPAVSIVFLNADFRMGGTLHDWDVAGIDANALFSYAWYPTLWKQIFGFSHLSGHDVFLGVELSSRIRHFNVGLKAGLQMYPNLVAHLYEKDGKHSQVRDNYLDVPVNIPNAFVVGVEVSLGGRGHSILRIWY